ncbi:hypothetical protein C9994_03555 [Marivirga lumbricoides]|uniref:DUF4272 domain-containing protein n=1 Tax=Marivirga lumbricoides TaxID=1046115 RepID=A0A2T4DTX2_9BACT|nr:hypothetical protein C9994_03555 [Marivirga lumbricoides]
MFWKKKHNDLVIQCPTCEWNPDGEKHWACSCGHKWNTFKTKGKCPKCKTQWEDTRCPACGKSTPHKDWYKTKEEIDLIASSGDQVLRTKKRKLESRLIDYGIRNHRISHLPYLDHSKERFQSAYDAGCRMMILYTISYAVHELTERDNIIQWFKDENIWDKVSPNEKKFLTELNPEEELIMDLSWRIESALTLGWCLNKIKTLPRLDNDNNEKEIEEFQRNVPELGDPLQLFLTQLEYRDFNEIYEENLLNELATTYFRNLMFNGKKDETNINRFTSFERHQVLNWLRTYYADESEITGELWDETDTST